MRKDCRYITAALLLVFTVAACTGRKHADTPLCPLPYDSLRTGDLIFRRGISMASNIVLLKEECYSHVGFVVYNDGWCVIHAVNGEPEHDGDFDRVKIDRIEQFVSPERARAVKIMHGWVSDSAAAVMARQAICLVNDSVRFDAGFDSNDHSRLYCTELIDLLYSNIGEDITEGRRTDVGLLCFPDKIIFPGDISSNKKLKSFFLWHCDN